VIRCWLWKKRAHWQRMLQARTTRSVPQKSGNWAYVGPPTYGTRWAAYRHLSHVLMIELQLHRVSLSRHHVGRSRSASRVELCPNRRVWRFCRITWRSGGGVVAFHRRSRSLMFAHDTYSGINGRLMQFVGVDSNAISINLGSTMVAMQVRSSDVTVTLLGTNLIHGKKCEISR